MNKNKELLRRYIRELFSPRDYGRGNIGGGQNWGGGTPSAAGGGWALSGIPPNKSQGGFPSPTAYPYIDWEEEYENENDENNLDDYVTKVDFNQALEFLKKTDAGFGNSIMARPGSDNDRRLGVSNSRARKNQMYHSKTQSTKGPEFEDQDGYVVNNDDDPTRLGEVFGLSYSRTGVSPIAVNPKQSPGSGNAAFRQNWKNTGAYWGGSQVAQAGQNPGASIKTPEDIDDAYIDDNETDSVIKRYIKAQMRDLNDTDDNPLNPFENINEASEKESREWGLTVTDSHPFDYYDDKGNKLKIAYDSVDDMNYHDIIDQPGKIDYLDKLSDKSEGDVTEWGGKAIKRIFNEWIEEYGADYVQYRNKAYPNAYKATKLEYKDNGAFVYISPVLEGSAYKDWWIILYNRADNRVYIANDGVLSRNNPFKRSLALPLSQQFETTRRAFLGAAISVGVNFIKGFVPIINKYYSMFHKMHPGRFDVIRLEANSYVAFITLIRSEEAFFSGLLSYDMLYKISEPLAKGYKLTKKLLKYKNKFKPAFTYIYNAQTGVRKRIPSDEYDEKEHDYGVNRARTHPQMLKAVNDWDKDAVWLETFRGRVWLGTSVGQEWLATEEGQKWLASEEGQEYLSSDDRKWLASEEGQKWYSRKIDEPEEDEEELETALEPKHIKEFCDLIKQKTKHFKNDNFIIAGGALRDLFVNETPNDIDVYASSEHYDNIVKQFRNCGFHYINEDIKATNLIDNNQVYQVINSKFFVGEINRFKDIKEHTVRLLQNYDFTINQIAYIPKTDSFIMSEHFVTDIQNRNLRCNYSIKDCNHTQQLAIRVLKFINKGYTPIGEIKKVADNLNHIFENKCSCGVYHVYDAQEAQQRLNGCENILKKRINEFGAHIGSTDSVSGPIHGRGGTGSTGRFQGYHGRNSWAKPLQHKRKREFDNEEDVSNLQDWLSSDEYEKQLRMLNDKEFEEFKNKEQSKDLETILDDDIDNGLED